MKVSNKLPAVPQIDIRIMNVQCRLKDAVDTAAAQLGLQTGGQATGDSSSSTGDNKNVRDLRFRISGLSVQSQKDGLICVSSVHDDGEMSALIDCLIFYFSFYNDYQ